MNENEAPLNILQLMDPSRTLISPPPEEELQFGFPRSNSSVQPKRKRNRPGGTPSKEATPNPKPRKAHRRQSSVQRDQHPIVEAESPTHATFLRRSQNPNADWLPIPGTSKTNSRRSVTPYEPPTDVFTPPQEIIRQTPVQALKARQRTTTPQTRTRTPLRVVVQTSIKKEMPAIDLSRPIDPPSPTDDPLLLLPSSSPIKFGRNLNDSSSDLPPILDWTTGPIVDTTDYPTSDSMDLDQPESFDGPMPLEGPVPAGWDSDSDEDDGNLPLPSLPHCQQQQLPRYSASPVPRTSLSLANFLPVRSHTTPPRARSRPFSPSPGPPVVIPETTPSTPTTSRPRPSTPPPSSANESYTTVVRRTKPDPATPETKARAEAWGIWGSPYPGRGTDGEGNGSFRMDGSFRRGKLLGDLSGDGAGPSVEQEEDEDEEMEEGVSFLRALREEDEAFARKKSAAQDEQGEEMEQGEEEGEDDMDEGEDMQEEEEVRQMSVELEDEEQEPIIAPTPIRPQVQQTRTLVTATMPVQTPPIRRVPFVPARAELASSSNSAPLVYRYTPVDADADTSTESASSVSPGPSVYIARGTRPPSAASGYVDAGEEIEGVLGGDVADRDDSEGDDDMDSDLLGLVKITSADPRAAARAAAILKQHDYDCFTRLRDKDKRRRHSFAGVSKTRGGSPASSSKVQDIAELRAKARAKELEEKKEKRARRQSARVVGERVYFPGSPVPVTTTELLAEAEREVVSSGMLSPAKAGRAVGESISASTPVPSRTARSGRRSSLAREVPLPDSDDDDDEEQEQDRVREWTKADWKTLDACFTDERIAVAQRLEMVLNLSVAPVAVPATLSFSTPVKRQRPQTDNGDAAAADVVMMASADAVDLAAVVRRFEDRMGGKNVLKGWGDSWAEETLTQRVRALQNKQRAGHVAPPTPRAAAATIDEDGNVFSKRRPNMEVPDFTPLGKRAMPPSRRSRLPDPVQGGLFSNLPPTPEPAKRRRVPGSLLAPRYSHLLEEARAVAGPSSSSSAAESAAQDVEGQDEEIQDEQTQDSSFASDESDGDAEMLPATPLREREEEQFPAQPVAPATIGNRVKGFIFSYLPTLAKTAPAAAPRTGLLHSRPRLPLPPLDILQKPRGPVTTPARPPLPKTTAPKDLVTLQPAPMPPPKTMIPRKVPPRRMKELKHVSPPPEQQPEQRVGPRPRTSSGGSVKDMVKNFEALDQARGKAPPEVKRVRSVGNFGKNTGGPGRPVWR
ncbi:hypothetical protein C8F01DRAFT_1163555 [Mycena amicta]|nr:hypothetical protein C8F01DRAFT_1163555 [Mycena amicta]